MEIPCIDTIVVWQCVREYLGYFHEIHNSTLTWLTQFALDISHKDNIAHNSHWSSSKLDTKKG